MPEIDNPLHLKIKSLLIFPIIKENEVLGVLKFWRSVSQKAPFVKQDEITLKTLEPLFSCLFEDKPLSESFILELSGSKKSSKHVQKSAEKEEDNAMILLQEAYGKNVQALDDLQTLYDQAQKSMASLEVSYQEVSKECEYLKADLKQYEQNEALYEQRIKEYNENFEVLESEYARQIEQFRMDEERKYKEHQEEIKTLKYINQKLKNAKEDSIEQIDKMKANLAASSVNKRFEKLDENIELIVEEFDEFFGGDEHTLMMFEMIIFALSSKKGLSLIEEKIKDSKVLSAIIDNYYFKTDIALRNEKVLISDMIDHIRSYEKSVFENKCALNIDIDNDMPTSLIFDGPKVQSILFHLLSDLYQFIDYSKDVGMGFVYKDKFMTIKIGGYIHEKNNLFKSIFRQAKMNMDDKDRQGLKMSRKLIERLKGSLDIDYSNSHYNFIVKIPALRVKM